MDGHETLCLIVSPDEGFNLFCCSTHRPAVVVAHLGTTQMDIRGESGALPSSAAVGWHYFFESFCPMLT